MSDQWNNSILVYTNFNWLNLYILIGWIYTVRFDWLYLYRVFWLAEFILCVLIGWINTVRFDWLPRLNGAVRIQDQQSVHASHHGRQLPARTGISSLQKLLELLNRPTSSTHICISLIARSALFARRFWGRGFFWGIENARSTWIIIEVKRTNCGSSWCGFKTVAYAHVFSAVRFDQQLHLIIYCCCGDCTARK